MPTESFPSPLMRQELEESWRLRLEAAQAHYQAASKRYRRLLQDVPDGMPLEHAETVALAREGESQALTEYQRSFTFSLTWRSRARCPKSHGHKKARWHVTALGLAVISVVDDDESIRASTKSLLRSLGYEVETFASADLFLESGALRETECLILDFRMPGMDGLELQRRLNAEDARVPIIFVTAHDDDTNRRKALDGGAVGVFGKPVNTHALVEAVQAVVGERE